eukprot:3487_1
MALLAYQTRSQWQKLQSPPFRVGDRVHVSINEQEFIVRRDIIESLESRQSRQLATQKYNIHQNKFVEYVTYRDNWDHDLTFNKATNDLYVRLYPDDGRGHNEFQLHAINVESNQCYVINNFPKGEHTLFIRGNFHVINAPNKHWIGSLENKTVKTLHDTLNVEDIQTMHCGKAIYIPSKESILLIGCWTDPESFINNSQGPNPKDIWIYSLALQKWRKVENVSFEGFHFGAVLTSNQRYIVLLGGYDGNHVSIPYIKVLDMKDDNNWKMKQSTICCPDNGPCSAVRTNGVDSNKLLVIGFIKQCFKRKEFEEMSLPPMYLMTIITEFTAHAEMIHWMKAEDTSHFGIYLKDILSSCTD